MIEGELFGYVKGAFTGTSNDFPGMIAEANASALFLDEISDMPIDLQRRFLRVLQEREHRPLGTTRVLKANFRVTAATNRPTPQGLAENRLCSDLHYGLNTFQIEVPPLRDRKPDVPPLLTFFVKQFATQLGKSRPEIMPETFQKLFDYSWAGNVREVQLLVALQQVDRTAAPQGGVQSPDNMEPVTILPALAQCHGNKKKAAELLGIQRPTFYNKLKRYAIEL